MTFFYADEPVFSVLIVLKQYPRIGQLIGGVVSDILTNSFMPHGIKLPIESSEMGTVKTVLG
ncbi:MAG: putative repeat protein (TIGR03833 family) [Paraglaciecola sp.]|jgi:uncharacterized repeat protein (TIGR03833 family)